MALLCPVSHAGYSSRVLVLFSGSRASPAGSAEGPQNWCEIPAFHRPRDLSLSCRKSRSFPGHTFGHDCGQPLAGTVATAWPDSWPTSAQGPDYQELGIPSSRPLTGVLTVAR